MSDKWEGNCFRSGYLKKKSIKDRLFNILLLIAVKLLLLLALIAALDLYLYMT